MPSSAPKTVDACWPSSAAFCAIQPSGPSASGPSSIQLARSRGRTPRRHRNSPARIEPRSRHGSYGNSETSGTTLIVERTRPTVSIYEIPTSATPLHKHAIRFAHEIESYPVQMLGNDQHYDDDRFYKRQGFVQSRLGFKRYRINHDS